MEKEIIHTALENLFNATGIEGVWRETDQLNGVLDLILNNQKSSFKVAVKPELRTHQLQAVEDAFHHCEDFLLVANRLYPKTKEELRQKGIPYLEANGNIFIKKEGLFLYVDTQKPLDIRKNKGNRAFTKTGLKVLFFLLQSNEAINLTQREIAEKANVGLGNIPQVIDGLKETGYLLPLNNKTYVWENKKALLERWIAEYATVLRPKLLKERYTLKGPWQDVKLDNTKTLWGGEPAADILTNHLRPEKFVLYTRESRMDLMKNYRFVPHANGEIEVLNMFWLQQEGQTVPPLLVYADLMLEGGKRNKETAELIYHEYIKPNL